MKHTSKKLEKELWKQTCSDQSENIVHYASHCLLCEKFTFTSYLEEE